MPFHGFFDYSLLYAALDAFVFLKMGTSIGTSCGVLL